MLGEKRSQELFGPAMGQAVSWNGQRAGMADGRDSQDARTVEGHIGNKNGRGESERMLDANGGSGRCREEDSELSVIKEPGKPTEKENFAAPAFPSRPRIPTATVGMTNAQAHAAPMEPPEPAPYFSGCSRSHTCPRLWSPKHLRPGSPPIRSRGCRSALRKYLQPVGYPPAPPALPAWSLPHVLPAPALLPRSPHSVSLWGRKESPPELFPAFPLPSGASALLCPSGPEGLPPLFQYFLLLFLRPLPALLPHDRHALLLFFPVRYPPCVEGLPGCFYCLHEHFFPHTLPP